MKIRKRAGENTKILIRTAYHELLARLWAAVHLAQSVRLGRDDDGLAEALMEARCFDKTDDSQAKEGFYLERESMNITDLRSERDAVEQQITKVLDEFHTKTGLHIVRVEIENISGQRIMDLRPIVLGQNVTVALEQV